MQYKSFSSTTREVTIQTYIGRGQTFSFFRTQTASLSTMDVLSHDKDKRLAKKRVMRRTSHIAKRRTRLKKMKTFALALYKSEL